MSFHSSVQGILQARELLLHHARVELLHLRVAQLVQVELRVEHSRCQVLPEHRVRCHALQAAAKTAVIVNASLLSLAICFSALNLLALPEHAGYLAPELLGPLLTSVSFLYDAEIRHWLILSRSIRPVLHLAFSCLREVHRPASLAVRGRQGHDKATFRRVLDRCQVKMVARLCVFLKHRLFLSNRWHGFDELRRLRAVDRPPMLVNWAEATVPARAHVELSEAFERFAL